VNTVHSLKGASHMVSKFNILHVGDMAGVAAVLSNEANLMGYHSHVIQLDTIDTYHIGDYYHNTTYAKSKGEMRAYLIQMIDLYDHIVVHDLIDFAEELEGTAMSYVFHGNMLRNSPKLMKRVENISTLENIFVTSDDLLQYSKNAELLVRPVDTKLFKPQKITSDEAFTMISKRFLDILQDYLEEFDIDFIVRDNYIVKYEEMPDLFSKYGVYVDVKYQSCHPPKIIYNDTLSLIGLQALACGLTVYNPLQKEFLGLPKGHEAKKATKEFIRVLRE